MGNGPRSPRDQGEVAPTGISFGHKSGGCAVKECVLTWGDFASCLKGQRGNTEREVSSGRHPRGFPAGVVAAETERRSNREGVSYDMSMREAKRQRPALAGGCRKWAVKPLAHAPATKLLCPRHEIGNTGSALLLAALTRKNLQQAWKRVKANKARCGRGWSEYF